MQVHLLTTDQCLAATLEQALQPDPITAFASTPDVLNHLLGHRDQGNGLLLIDLATIEDAQRIIAFIKSSPLRGTQIMTIGAAANYASLHPEMLRSITVTLRAPENAADFATVVGTLRAIASSLSKPQAPSAPSDPKGRWDKKE